MATRFLSSDALRLTAGYSPKCGSQSIRAWFRGAIEAATNEPVVDLDLFFIDPHEIDRYADYWKVFFFRDPLLRLVGFYTLWVVRDEALWCFADAQQRVTLRNKSFRQFLFALHHLHRHHQEPQHHLVPQLRNAEGIEFDEIIAVEQLSAGLVGLNHRFGLSVPIPHLNRWPRDRSLQDRVPDRLPEWFREHGIPAAELFYDDETRVIALEIYADDLAYYRRATGLDVVGLEH